MLIELVFCIGLSVWGGPEFLNCTGQTFEGERCPTESDLLVLRHSYLSLVTRRLEGNPKYKTTGRASVQMKSCKAPDSEV
jgi:hypothetical protein